MWQFCSVVVWYGSTVRRMNKFGYCSRGGGSRYFFFPLVLGVVVGCWCGGFLFFPLLLGTLFEKDVPWCFVSSCNGAPLSFPSHCLSGPQIQRGFLFGPCRSLSLTHPPDPRRFSGDGQSLHDVNILPFSSLLWSFSLHWGSTKSGTPKTFPLPPYISTCCSAAHGAFSRDPQRIRTQHPYIYWWHSYYVILEDM